MRPLVITILFLVFVFIARVPNGSTEPKIRQVRVLMLVKPDRPQLQGLRDGLIQAGYIQGQNMQLDMPIVRTPDELRTLASDFVKQAVSVVVTTGNVETEVAKDRIRQLPIVFMPASDPITAGFVKSFARPDSNLTGIALIRDLDSYGKQLEVFKETAPSLGKLAVLYDDRPNASPYAKALTQLKRVASNFGITIDERPVREIYEAELAVASLSRNSVDGIFVLCSSLFGGGPEAIIARANERKLPLFSCGWTHQGGFISFALDLYQVGRRGGWYVSEILRGAKPAELPVQVPLSYELTINLNTAKTIGLKIPATMLQRADKVIR